MIQKVGIYLALILAIVAIGVGIGYNLSTKHYEPIVATYDAAFNALNKKYNDTKLEQENTNVKLKKDFDDRERRINAYYDRLLHTKNSNTASPSTGSTKVNNEAITQGYSGVARSELEHSCALIANQLVEAQTFFVEHHFPVQE